MYNIQVLSGIKTLGACTLKTEKAMYTFLIVEPGGRYAKRSNAAIDTKSTSRIFCGEDNNKA